MTNPAVTSKRQARGSARPYLEGKGYAMRKRYRGNDIYVSGYKTEVAAEKAVRRKLTAIDNHVKASGRGADKTTLAQGLQDYAVRQLPFLKGAVQEARRINHYLRYAGLETLVVTPHVEEEEQQQAVKSGDPVHFEVTLAPPTTTRAIANGLHAHRKAQMTQNARTEKYRAVLATTAMGEVTRDMVLGLVLAMRRDRNAASTIALERSMLRVLFFYAFHTWKWTELQDNPATKIRMPEVDNIRKRVMSLQEQELLDASLADCRNSLVRPMVTLLRETAMRSSEPLEKAYWKDVDWTRKVLSLGDSKTGKRDVPLSPIAIQMLRELGPGEPQERIVNITYESLKASWQRACERAGIKDLNLHDLRRTAATRMALKTGNTFLVKALTGHKTMAMMERYIKVGADDVVRVMHAPEGASELVPVPAPVTTQIEQPVPVLAVTAASSAQVVYTPQQMQDLVQMTVNATLAGLKDAVVIPAPPQSPGVVLALVAQRAPDAPAEKALPGRRAA